jgi:exopolysaccharide biosynthesis WecB/TagA/CpsF family protein
MLPSLTLLLSQIRTIQSADAESELWAELASAPRPVVLSFVNTYAVNLSRNDENFFECLTTSSYLLRDGSGVSLLCRLFGIPPGRNGCGTDTIPRLLDYFIGRRVALCGTSDTYVSKAADHVRALGCSVDLACNGFADIDVYLELIKAARPDLVILGMGMPKQELVAHHLARRLDFPVAIVCGGAILDYWAERFPRAPLFVRRLGFEWVFRLMLEPRRLWRRFIVGNASFVVWALYMRAALFAVKMLGLEQRLGIGSSSPK